MFLYVITNLVNGKRYVGITIDFERRWREHCAGKGSLLVHRAIKKYGIDNIKFEVVCKATEEYVKEMEVKFIRDLNTMQPNGYNFTRGGEGTVGREYSDETRKRMRDNHRGFTGQQHSDVTKKKMSDAQSGTSKPHYLGGKNPKAQPVSVDGVKYECLKEAAEALNVSYSTLWKAKQKAGSNVFTYERGQKKRGAHCKAQKIVVDGVEFECLRDAAEALGIKYSTLRQIRRRAGSNTFTYQPKGVLTPITLE